MTNLKDTKLVLFFTEGVSLQTWDEGGILERETAIYKRLLEHLGSVSFVTYGDESDMAFEHRLGGIKVLPNRWGLHPAAFAMLAPFLYHREIQGATFVKTHQLVGARVGLIAKLLCGVKTIARVGHLNSVLYGGKRRLRRRVLDRLDLLAFRAADRVVVTTRALRICAHRDCKVAPGKVCVIPNYVDTDLFFPYSSMLRPLNQICFVGHLKRVKGPGLLLAATRDLDVNVSLLGDGPMRRDLLSQVDKTRGPVQFPGVIPNYRLPYEFGWATIFVAPSQREGHPKALIEAMACGLPVIGTNVPGIRELIRHEETGLLCNETPESLRQAIVRLLGDADLRAELGKRARQFVVEQFSLNKVLEWELVLLRSLLEDDA